MSESILSHPDPLGHLPDMETLQYADPEGVLCGGYALVDDPHVAATQPDGRYRVWVDTTEATLAAMLADGWELAE